MGAKGALTEVSETFRSLSFLVSPPGQWMDIGVCLNVAVILGVLQSNVM